MTRAARSSIAAGLLMLALAWGVVAGGALGWSTPTTGTGTGTGGAPSGAAGGDLAGTYPDPTIGANAVALGTDTTGGYAASATEGGSATSIAANTVGSSNITDNAVAYGDLQQLSTDDRLLGLDGTAPGNVEELSLGSGLGLSAANTVGITDVEVTSCMGLTSAADRICYWTGLGTASLATLTSYGRTLIGLADNVALTAQVQAATSALKGAVQLGVEVPRAFVLANDQQESAAAVADATGLTMAPSASSGYFCEFFGVFSSTNAANGFWWQWVGNGDLYDGGVQQSSNAATGQTTRIGTNGTTVQPANACGGTGNCTAYGWTIVTTSAAPPAAIKVQFRTEAAAGESVTLKKGSFMRCQKMY